MSIAEPVTPDVDGEPKVRPIAYRALADELRESIKNGAYANGQRLPTEAELCAARGVGRQTVRRALQDLVAEGLIFRIRGRGTFAVGGGRSRYAKAIGSLDDLVAMTGETEFETLRPLQPRINVEAAGRLRLGTDEVMEGTVRRFYDDVAFSLTHIYLPTHIGRQLRDRGIVATVGERYRTSIMESMDSFLPEPIVACDQSITATTLEPQWAEQIGLEPMSPVLRIDRLYYDARDQAIELFVTYFNPDRYSYRLELRRAAQP